MKIERDRRIKPKGGKKKQAEERWRDESEREMERKGKENKVGCSVMKRGAALRLSVSLVLESGSEGNANTTRKEKTNDELD